METQDAMPSLMVFVIHLCIQCINKHSEKQQHTVTVTNHIERPEFLWFECLIVLSGKTNEHKEHCRQANREQKGFIPC